MSRTAMALSRMGLALRAQFPSHAGGFLAGVHRRSAGHLDGFFRHHWRARRGASTKGKSARNHYARGGPGRRSCRSKVHRLLFRCLFTAGVSCGGTLASAARSLFQRGAGSGYLAVRAQRVVEPRSGISVFAELVCARKNEFIHHGFCARGHRRERAAVHHPGVPVSAFCSGGPCSRGLLAILRTAASRFRVAHCSRLAQHSTLARGEYSLARQPHADLGFLGGVAVSLASFSSRSRCSVCRRGAPGPFRLANCSLRVAREYRRAARSVYGWSSALWTLGRRSQHWFAVARALPEAACARLWKSVVHQRNAGGGGGGGATRWGC